MMRARHRSGRIPAPTPAQAGLALCLAAGLLAAASPVAAQAPRAADSEAAITDLDVVAKHDRLIVSASLSDSVSRDVEKEIRQGISKAFYYYAVLKRRVPMWKDEEMVSSTVRYRIWYDLVKQQFVISHRQGGDDVRRTAERFDEVRRLISHIRDVTIPLATPLQPGDTYYVSVKAEMRSAKLPVYIEYFLFFLPVAQLSTPWADSPPFTAKSLRPS